MPGLITGLWPARALNIWIWPEPGFHVWRTRALNRALARSRISSLACPGSQHGFGPNLGFKFGMPGLSTSTWLWCERRFQVWHARALNRFGTPGLPTGLWPEPGFKFGMPGLPTWLWPEPGFHVWHARALNRALFNINMAFVRMQVSSLACPGSQQVWHARAPNRALARSRVSRLACPGSQHGFGPNLDFMFGMPGLSTGLWPEAGFEVWHARALKMALARTWVSSLDARAFNINMALVRTQVSRLAWLSTWLWPELGFQVWHARAFNINMVLVRTQVSSLACPGSQQVWHARAPNRALARSRVSSLACPGSQHQHGFGANAGIKFGMPGLPTGLWPEAGFQVWHARAPNMAWDLGFMFGMPGLSTGLWPEAGFQVWRARAPNMALARTWVSCLACPGSEAGFQVWHARAFNMALARTWVSSLACPGFQHQQVSSLACPGSQHGFGPNLGFKFGMPGLSTSTWLWCERRFQVWHARAPNRALARSRASSLACPGSQHGFGPNLGFMFGMPGLSTSTWLWCERRFQVWHARALNMALARTWVSSLACPGFQHQHGFDANAGFKFGMPGLSTGLACPGSQQGFGPKPGFKFGMPGLPTWLWPETGFHVWHARALNRALARSRISSLACPGSQHGFGPNLGFKFGMPGLSTSTWLWCERRFQVWHARALNRFGMPGLPTGLWPEAGFQVWHARAPNMALARTWISSLACPGFQHQHGFGANAGFKFGMPGLSTGLACPGSQQGFGPKPGFKFGMPGLSTWLWPELGFQVWHARAFNINMALVRTQVSKFGMPGLPTGLWPEAGFEVWHAQALKPWLWPEPGFHVWHARALNRALARSRISSLACPGSQHGFGPNLGFKFGMPGLSTSTGLWCERRFQVWHARALNRFGMPGLPTGLWPEAGFQVWHARAPNMAFGPNLGQHGFGMPGLSTWVGPKPDFKFGMPGLSTWLWPEPGFQVWHARAFNINMALVRTQVSSLACPGSQQVWHARAPNRALVARSERAPNMGFEPGFHVWHARALNSRISSLACPGSQHMALARTWVSSLACPGFQHQHGPKPDFKFGMPGLSTGKFGRARAPNMALARTWVSSLACPGSAQGFGPKPDFKFGMPGLSTWLWPELGFQVWHARAFNINMALVRTQVSSLACPGSQQVWHARAPNRALAQSRVSSLACPGSQHLGFMFGPKFGFGPNLGFKFGMPGLNINMALGPNARASTGLACPGSQQGFGPKPGFKFGMPGLACPSSTWLWGFGPNARAWHFKFGMPGLASTSTWLWPELGFQVWHARAFNINVALVRTQVSSLACPGSQQVWHARAPNRALGFQVWHGRAPNMALARTWVSCLACPGSQQGFGPKPDFKFGMASARTWVSSLACPGSPGSLWPEAGFQVWHARVWHARAHQQGFGGFGPKVWHALGFSSLVCPGFQQARTWVSSLACPGFQHQHGWPEPTGLACPGLWPEAGLVFHWPEPGFGMPGLSTWLWPELGALARTWVSSLACQGFHARASQHGFCLACPGSQQGFGPKPDFKFGMPGLSTWLWPELGFQVWHARAFNINMALVRTWVSSLACPGSQQVWHARALNRALARSRVSSLACPGSQHGFGPNLGFMFGMPGLSTGLWPEAGFQVWHASQHAFAPNPGFKALNISHLRDVRAPRGKANSNSQKPTLYYTSALFARRFST